MTSPRLPKAAFPQFRLSGGRMIKWKGQVASLSPQAVDLRSGVSLAALAGALALAGGAMLAPGLAVAGSCTGRSDTFACSGAANSGSDTTQNLSASGTALQVTTSAGFGITTTSGKGINLTGDNGISFTDANSSAITGATFGIYGKNSTTGGAISITTTGQVTGGSGSGAGIFANNAAPAGTDLTISAADVSGHSGITAVNMGTGATSITVTGTAVATGTANIFGSAIIARSYGTSLTIQAASVTGGYLGIYGKNIGTGTLSITTTGAVVGTSTFGIKGYSNGGDLTIDTASVSGGYRGIEGRLYGTGSMALTVSGAVTGGTGNGAGIYTKAPYYGSVTIDLQSTASVSASSGVAIKDGNGNATVTVDGALVTGSISLRNGADTLTISTGTDLSGVTTMSGGTDSSTDTLNLKTDFSGDSLTDWEVINLDATAADFTVGAVISGSGALNVAGTGTVTLSGTNTLRGATTISGGTLNLTGSLAGSAVTVASGATLTGTGSVGSLVAQSGSTVFTGAGSARSAGLTVSGNATLNAGSTLTIGVYGSGAGESSQLIVGGSASLAGDLYVDVTDGNTGAGALASGATISNVLVTTGGITGSFASVTDNSVLFDFTAVTNGNAVDLGVTGSSTTAADTGVLRPATGAAGVIDTLIADGTSGDMQDVVDEFGSLTTEDAVADAVYQTLPALSGGASKVTSAASAAASNAKNKQKKHGHGHGNAGLGLANGAVWMSPLGGWAHQSQLDDATGYDAQFYGMIGGADAEVSPGLRLGLALAYVQTRVDSASDIVDNRLVVDGYEASLYGTWDVAEDVSLLGDLTFGRNEFDGSRHMSFATLSRTAQASYGGYAFSAETSVEKRFLVANALTFTPSVGLRYRASWDEGYAETGANALNLQVDGQQSRNLLSGVDGQFDYMLANGMELSANAGVAYDLINDRSHLTVAYQGAASNSFQVDGPKGNPWTGHAGVGLLINLDSGVDVSAAYQFGAGDGLSTHTAGLSAKLAF